MADVDQMLERTNHVVNAVCSDEDVKTSYAKMESTLEECGAFLPVDLQRRLKDEINDLLWAVIATAYDLGNTETRLDSLGSTN